MIERLSEVMKAALLSKKFLPFHKKNSFHMKKNLFSLPIKSFLTLELSQYSKNGSTVFQVPAVTVAD